MIKTIRVLIAGMVFIVVTPFVVVLMIGMLMVIGAILLAGAAVAVTLWLWQGIVAGIREGIYQ